MTKDTEFEILLRLAATKSVEQEIEALENIEIEEVPVSDKARRKFYRALRRETLKNSAALTVFKRVAVACMAVITIGFGVCMSIQPVRAAFWDAIVTWYEDYIAVLFEPEEEMPKTIEEQITPVVPDGWVCEVLEATQYSVVGNIVGNNGEMILYQQQVDNGDDILADNTDCEMQKIVINGNVDAFVCFYTDGRINIIWKDKYVFMLMGYQISADALLDIATTIKPK